MISCIPNFITVLRIIGTFALLFLSPAELSFLIIYLVCGLTDILDGWLARKLKITSVMGSRLDTAADLFYYIVMAIKIFPALLTALPPAVWIPVWGTALLRICMYLYVALRFHRLASSHTLLNKLTGFLVFCLPFSLLVEDITIPYSWVGATVAAIAAFYDLFLILRDKQEAHPA
ncbi:MAG: CDP-alcohol phosphatidyltransferase family protein [Oscillospiraceae bacterium]|nr:CDP-alcohol phosphatidyltransferase family protein [Oscillospiraceae bacterium]